MKECKSKKLVWLCLAVALTWTVASAASAQVLKPLPDGFPSRSITIINVDDPGTRDGIYGRMFQSACRGLSPVPILVSDEPIAQGGTWMKLNELLKRPGAVEGYYPVIIAAGMSTDLLVDPLTKDINAKLTDLKMILITEQLCYIFLQKKNAPWGKTFDGFIKYGKEHPNTLKYVSFEVGSFQDIAMEWIMAKYGVKVKKVPQGSMQECASAVGAGEADFTMVASDVATTNYQAGRVDVSFILTDVLPAPWDKDPNVSSAKTLGIPSFVGTILGLGVNGQVPQAHVDWMYQLFHAASQKPEFQKRWQGMIPGNVPRPMTGSESDKMIKDIYDAMDQPIRDIGMHVDQQKKK